LCATGLHRVRTLGWITGPGRIRCPTTVTRPQPQIFWMVPVSVCSMRCFYSAFGNPELGRFNSNGNVHWMKPMGPGTVPRPGCSTPIFGILKLTFDATSWFAKASDDEIFALATVGWASLSATDGLVRDLEVLNPQPASFFAEMKLPKLPNGTAATIQVAGRRPYRRWVAGGKPPYPCHEDLSRESRRGRPFLNLEAASKRG
jgi:hypothetical protein